jgi:hypothetical protein
MTCTAHNPPVPESCWECWADRRNEEMVRVRSDADPIVIPYQIEGARDGWWIWNGHEVRINCPKCCQFEIAIIGDTSRIEDDGVVLNGSIHCPKCGLKGKPVLERFAEFFHSETATNEVLK